MPSGRLSNNGYPRVESSRKVPKMMQKVPLKRRIIPHAPRGAQSGQIGTLDEINPYLPILAVLLAIDRRVTKDVLIMERAVNFFDRIGEIVEVADREHSSTRFLGKIGKSFHAAGSDPRSEYSN